MFLDVLSRVGIRSVNRVCFYKYTHNLHISQFFLWFFLKTELTQKNLTQPLKIIKRSETKTQCFRFGIPFFLDGWSESVI